ncbi:MAG TPA: zinc ABC transporter substrate-binding protein [Burkholderiales bacterium]|nr:zinc ABC transporter substrate-binding protein [Burkholderiales bacterium]
MNRFLALLALALYLGLPAAAAAKIDVFACVPEWASLAQELGGDKVSVYQATTARQDPHRVEARPSLVARMRSADLIVCTGADLEVGWLPVLLQTSGNRKVQRGQPGHFLAADFVDKLEVPTVLDRAEGDIHPQGNPHIQLNPHHIAKVAAELSRRLAQIDPANAVYYAARGEDFQKRWREAIRRWEHEAAGLKALRLVGYHKGATYLCDWLGMKEVANLEPKPGMPPSAAHLASLLSSLQSQPADAIIRMAYNDPKAPQWLSQRTGIPVVELPFTVGGTPAAKDLFGLFDDTLARLRKATGR